ncbi:MAG TPA: hypothetical protein VMU99_08760, partial [Acidimicrobiales bacterium]|nr:hypothetical protein [Acidimicrobiales bacterium]
CIPSKSRRPWDRFVALLCEPRATDGVAIPRNYHNNVTTSMYFRKISRSCVGKVIRPQKASFTDSITRTPGAMVRPRREEI